VVDVDGEHLEGVYTTGWIKRGPVGLIGHTKSDAAETIKNLVDDLTDESGEPRRTATDRSPQAVTDFLEARGVHPISWAGWELLDAHERGLGVPRGRERIKVVPRDEMIAITRGELPPT